MYVPFIMSEFMDLSGMITAFVAGIFARRYMEPNVSDATKQHAEMLFRLFAFLAETSIFLELGLSFFGMTGKFQWKFIGCATVAALVGRALSIYPLAAFFNYSLKSVVQVFQCGTGERNEELVESVGLQYGDDAVPRFSLKTPQHRRDKLIPPRFMHMLWFAGLRGAVAYACARDFPDENGHREEFVAATMIIVLFTILVMGGATEPLMDRLQIDTNVDPAEYMREWRSRRHDQGWFHKFGKYLDASFFC